MINHFKKLEIEGKIDKALDLMYDWIDDKHILKQYADISEMLNSVDLNTASVTLKLTLLCSTAPEEISKHLIAERKKIYYSVKEDLDKRGENSEQILYGLLALDWESGRIDD